MSKSASLGVIHRPQSNQGQGPRIVAGGHKNLLDGVESECRQIVEAKYADEWNEATLFRRWRLRRIINEEVAVLVAERMTPVTEKAVF